MAQIHDILMPQLNVNDETAVLLEWLVEHGSEVSPGQAICEVETSKSTAELEAEHDGLLFHTAEPATTLKVGERIGLIGPDLASIEAKLARDADEASKAKAKKGGGAPRATPSARALAAEHGVTLEDIAALGVRGSIKETDVRRYLDQQDPAPEGTSAGGPPPGLLELVEDEGPLSRHERSVADNLRRSVDSVLLTSLDREIDLTGIKAGLERARANKTMVSVLHLAIAALGRTLGRYPRLMSFVEGGRVFVYRSVNIALVVRTQDGRLFTPVVRDVDGLDLVATGKACLQSTLAVNRGQLRPEDLEGACFTVSHIPTSSVTRFVALPNRYQSAILAISGERPVAAIIDGSLAERPTATLTLSYDHQLCDGMYAADFLDTLVSEMENMLD